MRECTNETTAVQFEGRARRFKSHEWAAPKFDTKRRAAGTLELPRASNRRTRRSSRSTAGSRGSSHEMSSVFTIDRGCRGLADAGANVVSGRRMS
jgi:hypothetical protein